jgi:hypothetical protein
MMLQICHVADKADSPVSDFFDSLIDDIRTPAGDDDLRALLCEEMSGRLADAAIATGNDRDLVLEMLHLFISFLHRA